MAVSHFPEYICLFDLGLAPAKSLPLKGEEITLLVQDVGDLEELLYLMSYEARILDITWEKRQRIVEKKCETERKVCQLEKEVWDIGS